MSDYDSSDDENVKTTTPCGNYRLDTEGVNFGDCKCGHSKASHMRKKSNKAGVALSALRGGSDSDSDDEEKAAEPCGKYRVDTQGANFGDCKCGWPKAAHGKKGENHVAKAAKSLKSHNKSFADEEYDGDGPCDKFRVDTTAPEFGTCKCGFKRAEHDKKQQNKASEAVEALKKKNKKKNKEAAKIAYDRESVQGKIDAKREEMAALEAKNKKTALKDSPQEADEALPAVTNGGAARTGGGGGGCCIVM